MGDGRRGGRERQAGGLGQTCICGDHAYAPALEPLRQYLCKLDLSRTKVTSESLVFLSTFPRLVRLSLIDTQVGDVHLEKLSKLTHLQHLNLAGTKVTDAGLRKLARCKSLQDLFIWGSKATSKGRQELERKLPEAKIRF